MKDKNLNMFAQITDEVRASLIEYLEDLAGGVSNEDELVAIGLDQLLEALGAEGHFFT